MKFLQKISKDTYIEYDLDERPLIQQLLDFKELKRVVVTFFKILFLVFAFISISLLILNLLS